MQQIISVTQSFNAPISKAFAALADHNALGPVLGLPVKRIRDAAGGDPNGVGSIRRLGPWPIGTQETVTEFVPNERIVYTVTKFGGPIVNHQGQLDFRETADGSEVTWQIEFDSFPPMAGAAIKSVLEKGVGVGLHKLAKTL